MADELILDEHVSGATVYFQLRQDGNVVVAADGSLVAFSKTDWANYKISSTEEQQANGRSRYVGGVSANTPAGTYEVRAYGQAATSPGNDLLLGVGVLHWDGTEELSAVQIAARAKAVDDLTKEGGDGDLAAIKGKTDFYPYSIQPFSASSTATGRIDPTYLTAYQDSRLQAGPISVNDADGDPVNLGDKTLTLVAWEHDDLDTTVFELSTEGESPGLTVGGDDNNQVLIDADASNFATAGQLDYRIYDATDADNPSPLIDGVIEVVAGRAPASE